MGKKSKNEGMLKKTYLLPSEICNNLEKASKEHHRNMNEELIFILSEYFGDSFVKLDSVIKKAVVIYAETKGFTVTEATNYLVSTRISVMEEIHNIMIAEADKAHEQQIADYHKQQIADYEDEIQAAVASKKQEAS